MMPLTIRWMAVWLGLVGSAFGQTIENVRSDVAGFEAISDQDPTAQAQALRTLYRHAATLLSEVNGAQEKEEVSGQVAAALEGIRSKLIRLVEGSDRSLKGASVYVLQYVAFNNEAQDALTAVALDRSLAQSDSSTVRTAIFALSRNGAMSDAVRLSLIDRINDRFTRHDPQFELWASDAAQLGLTEVVPILSKALREPQVDIRAVADALKRIGPAARVALPDLTQALNTARRDKADFRIIESLEFAIAALGGSGSAQPGSLSSTKASEPPSNDNASPSPVRVTQAPLQPAAAIPTAAASGGSLWIWPVVGIVVLAAVVFILRKKAKM